MSDDKPKRKGRKARKADKKSEKKLTGRVYYTDAEGNETKDLSKSVSSHYGPRPATLVVNKPKKKGKGASYKPKKATTKTGRKANRRSRGSKY